MSESDIDEFERAVVECEAAKLHFLYWYIKILNILKASKDEIEKAGGLRLR